MESESLAEKALKILREKSEKALETTKNILLAEKMESERADEAIKYYVPRLHDTTRPGLLSIACEAVGGDSKEVTPLQVAMLLIDATMDIHDDIIDESIAKSEGQTIYGKFGKETALLIGNVLIVKGFHRLCETLENLPKEKRLLIMNTAKDFLVEVANAHILEVQLKNKKWKTKPDEFLTILSKKAADIEGHMQIGAAYGGGTRKEILAIGKYGRNLGLLLAVRADFVDVFEPQELMNRVRHECLPLQVLYALQDENCGKEIRGILSRDDINENDCGKLVNIISKTKGSRLLNRYLSKIEKEAMQALSTLRDSHAKQQLQIITASMLEDL